MVTRVLVPLTKARYGVSIPESVEEAGFPGRHTALPQHQPHYLVLDFRCESRWHYSALHESTRGYGVK